MVRKTIAVIGTVEGEALILLEALARQKLRLLVVSGQQEANLQAKEHLEMAGGAAEIEFISCEREGCWEADMIMVAPATELTPSLLEKIRTVATQKPVVRISEDKTQYEESLKDLLPHARVVELKVDPQARQICLSGQDPDASAAVKRIFENTGYDIKT